MFKHGPMEIEQLKRIVEAAIMAASTPQTLVQIIVRNLYERTADCRWWATDEAFYRCLEDPTQERVLHAIKRLGVRHAVAQDNRYATWKAYGNEYWPAHYLVDARGRIQYKHFGEGAYERTEAVIQKLIAARAQT